MQEGLLWFDNNPNRALAEKVKQAAARYKDRLRKKPTVCYLNVDQFDGAIEEINGISLKPAANIQPDYLWIGVDNRRQRAKAA